MINYNEIMKFKKELEELYTYLCNAHQELLNTLENSDCIDNEKVDTFHSYLKEYESKIELIKSNFILLKSENKKIESCFSQVKLLKKKRLTKLESNMKKCNDDDFDMPF